MSAGLDGGEGLGRSEDAWAGDQPAGDCGGDDLWVRIGRNDQPATGGSTNEATARVPPGQSDRVNLQDAVRGAANNSGFSLEARGNVVPGCYAGVLSPYRWVAVKISDSQFSTKYLIHQVTHTLSRSVYKQSFSMKGNGVSVAAGGSAGAPQPSANMSVSFNVQVSIF